MKGTTGKVGLPLMRSVLTALAKSIIIGLMATASATFSAIENENYGSTISHKTTPIISNEEMKDVMEINIYLEEPGLLNKDVSETIDN